MRGTGFYIFAGFLGMPITRDDFCVEKKSSSDLYLDKLSV